MVDIDKIASKGASPSQERFVGGRLHITRFTEQDLGRQREPVDPFEELYSIYTNIIQPKLPFYNLYVLYEQSDILQSCVEALRNNVDGFGYQLDFCGDDLTEKDTKQSLAAYNSLTKFFDQINEDESFQSIRMLMRKDYEVTGNSCMEVVRFPQSGKIAAVYYMPVVDVRMCKLDEQPVSVDVLLHRDGKLRKVKIKRRFRSYVQVMGDLETVRWFKSFGDPRPMDALTGKHVKTRNPATEIMWFKQNFGGRTYGMPRYTGAITDVRGRSMAQYVNYDLFDHQGIAPIIIMIENGTLTDESKLDLEKILRGMRGVENFNRIVILEALPELQGVDDKSTVKVNIKNMSDYRQSDLMFTAYLSTTENVIRQAFRLPPLYVGSSSEYSFAASYSSQQIAEEQVFAPERASFDEVINNKIIQQEFGINIWKYRTKGPRVGSADQLRMAIREFVNAGALSVDNTVQLANELLGTQFSPYNTEWSKQPAAFVRAMIQSGRMTLSGSGESEYFDSPSNTGNPESTMADGSNPLGR